MAIDFPNSPSVNDTFTVDSRTWQWNGTAWRIITTAVGPTGPQGPSGSTGPAGANGADGRFFTSAVAPTSPVEGDAWFNSDTSRLYVYFDGFWVEASAPVVGPTGPTGPAGSNGATGPTGPAGVFTQAEKDELNTMIIMGAL